jgi:NAD(P)-dependent dehydrogenase (short-subunit alcohol dehydrogenase family)
MDAMPADFSIKNEVAIVTGASAGLGRHFAKVLAASGAKVAVCARRRDPLDELADEIRSSGGVALSIELDVTDSASVASAVDQAVNELGPVSILINNAGLAVDKPLLETCDDDWDRVLDTNLKGAWMMARETARHMMAAGIEGKMVNIASILGVTATPRVHSYAASKAGLIHLTRTLALELARHKIRVNAIAPGYVETDLNKELLAGPTGDHLKKRVPQRRFAQPADLDGALLLLCSNAGAYMTGSVITVDGGMTLSTL